MRGKFRVCGWAAVYLCEKICISLQFGGAGQKGHPEGLSKEKIRREGATRKSSRMI